MESQHGLQTRTGFEKLGKGILLSLHSLQYIRPHLRHLKHKNFELNKLNNNVLNKLFLHDVFFEQH